MLAAAAIVALVSHAHSVIAQCGSSYGAPLINQYCPWPYSGPEKLDSSDGPRGMMQGINICNATTQNQQSQCVNAVVNNISDFCFFSSPDLDIIADTEGETVAYCTKSGYGTRLMPAGTLLGVQVVNTPGYVAIGGYINGPLVNIPADDQGGELDPHGADNRGNPIGSLVYSNVYGNGSNNSYAQTAYFLPVNEWHIFISGSIFCMKICNPNYNDPSGNLCLNIYDTVGCNGNVPLDYNSINGTFQSCLGDVQQVPNGGVLPIPATSSCTTYASTSLYTALPSSSGASSAASSATSTLLTASTPSVARAAVAAPTTTFSSTSTSLSGAMSIFTSNVQLQGSLLVSLAMAIGAAAVFL